MAHYVLVLVLDADPSPDGEDIVELAIPLPPGVAVGGHSGMLSLSSNVVDLQRRRDLLVAALAEHRVEEKAGDDQGRLLSSVAATVVNSLLLRE